MNPNYKVRRLVALLIVAIASLSGVAVDMARHEFSPQTQAPAGQPERVSGGSEVALEVLARLPEKGRAPKTHYERSQFSSGWGDWGECDVRNIILRRDLENVTVNDICQVVSGSLQDPYTGKKVEFRRGASSSSDVQIDHVVALSNAWQTGAQLLSAEQRHAFANDPLNLLAVDGDANQQKSDGDAATWLPSNKAFRCQYVARQVAVKQVYGLWVTPAEARAMHTVLDNCPSQTLPVQ